MRNAFLIGFTILVMSVGTAMSATYFTANLTGSQEVPANASVATGFGRVTLNDAENQVTASVYYGNPTVLGSNVTVGHIHTGTLGANGPVTFNLAPAAGVTSGSVVNASFAVTPTQVADLKAGNMYFNIHTTGFTGGEIRGQITVDSPYFALMNGGQENPAVSTAATGFGAVSVNTATNQALVSIRWSGLSGSTVAGHAHSGRSRTNGPVICNFNLVQPAAGTLTDTLCTFSPAQITSLRQGQLYLNIHTAANSGGEIRGQIQRRRSTTVDFDGDSKTDFAIARNNTGGGVIEWWMANSGGGVSAFFFGASSEFSTSRIMMGDFDGDGKDDPTIWRSGASPLAGFLILNSATTTVTFEQFGTTGDDPRVIGDYDGDGRCDVAVYRSGAQSTWFYRGSLNNPAQNITFIPWGTSGDFANPGDFDGDGKNDFVVQRGGVWWTLRSSDSTFTLTNLGSGASFGVPGDYDGDGKTDIGITTTEAGLTAWYYSSTLNPAQNLFVTRREFGSSTGRLRSQGDFNGDGKSDFGVWTTSAPQTFWYLPSGGGSAVSFPWGTTGDFAITGFNNR